MVHMIISTSALLLIMVILYTLSLPLVIISRFLLLQNSGNHLSVAPPSLQMATTERVKSSAVPSLMLFTINTLSKEMQPGPFSGLSECMWRLHKINLPQESYFLKHFDSVLYIMPG